MSSLLLPISSKKLIFKRPRINDSLNKHPYESEENLKIITENSLNEEYLKTIFNKLYLCSSNDVFVYVGLLTIVGLCLIPIILLIRFIRTHQITLIEFIIIASSVILSILCISIGKLIDYYYTHIKFARFLLSFENRNYPNIKFEVNFYLDLIFTIKDRDNMLYRNNNYDQPNLVYLLFSSYGENLNYNENYFQSTIDEVKTYFNTNLSSRFNEAAVKIVVGGILWTLLLLPFIFGAIFLGIYEYYLYMILCIIGSVFMIILLIWASAKLGLIIREKVLEETKLNFNQITKIGMVVDDHKFGPVFLIYDRDVSSYDIKNLMIK